MKNIFLENIKYFVSLVVITNIGLILFSGLVINYQLYIITSMFFCILIALFVINNKEQHLLLKSIIEKKYDALTGLYNRQSFYQIIENFNVQNNNQKISLIFLDIDNFKEINNKFGNHKGDEILKNIGNFLLNIGADKHELARMGGDEFCFLIKDYDTLQLDSIIKKILNKFKNEVHIDSHHLTVSIGVIHTIQNKMPTTELLKKVEQAMYEVKLNGKSGYVYYDENKNVDFNHKLTLYADIKSGIENNEFEVYLQPIVDLNTNKTTKAEALIRWNHPTKGFVSPDNFILFAEQMGLIDDLGQYVFNQVVEILNEINQEDLKISINISPSQLKNNQLVDTWSSYLKEKNIDPNQIVLEITEGVMMVDSEYVLDILNDFRESGFTIAIDDFGTGYSSLSYLYKYEVDYIKIDKSFIHHKAEKNKKIIKMLILMAKDLNIKVIAEGVETVEQLSFLKENKCDYVQGYYYSKPLKISDFKEYFKS